MRVLIINTSEQTGGAALAAKRLTTALNLHGVEARMLVGRRQTADRTVITLKRDWRLRWHFLWERLCIFTHLHFRKKHLFELDIANTGSDITRLPVFREADIIHLHWVNQGMLSLAVLRKILESGKPVVWTMHDIWPATSVCHLTMDCKRYLTACQQCPYLPPTLFSDLAAKVWKRKKSIYDAHRIMFVGCSRWLEENAARSALLQGQPVTNIPNPIDTDVFSPGDRAAARHRLRLPLDKRLILFAAHNATNPNKGLAYMTEACRILARDHSSMPTDTALVVMGKNATELAALVPFEVFALGYLDNPHTIADVYRASDVFVLPSLSENLPNTIMEAMACGIPCVGFRVGGIPEEIDHLHNGYVARFRDAEDLAYGIRHLLFDADRQKLSAHAVEKVASHYTPAIVAQRYITLYRELLEARHTEPDHP